MRKLTINSAINSLTLIVFLTLSFASSATAEDYVSTKLAVDCSEFRSFTMSANGLYFAIGKKNGLVKLWDVLKSKELQELETGGEVTAVAISPDNSKIAAASGLVVQIWDLKSGHCLQSLSGHTDRIDSLDFNSDSSLLLSAGLDKYVKVWNVSSGSLFSSWLADKAWLRSCQFIPGSSLLLTGGYDNKIKIWNPKTGALVRKIYTNNLCAHDFKVSPDGRTIATCISYSGAVTGASLQLVDMETGNLLSTIFSSPDYIHCPNFSSNGKYLAFASKSGLFIYDFATKKVTVKISQPGAVLISTEGGPTSLTSQSAKRWVPSSLADSVIANSSSKTDVREENGDSAKNPSSSAKVAVKKPNPDRPISDKWALVVGISKFKNGAYNLKYASKDAKDFYFYLVKEAGFKKDHVLLLLDEAATRENIITAFGDKYLPAVAQPDDMIVVFVSTHGTPKHKDQGGRNYIVAHDTDINKLYATGVDMDELYRRVKEAVPSDRALIVMDTCYSGGGVPGAKAMGDGANFNATELAQGSGHLVITSSSPNERSWESQISPNGVFTKYFLESLRSNNGDVKKSFPEASEKVSWEAKSAFNATQTPQLGGEWEGKNLNLGLPVLKPRQLFNTELNELIKKGDPDLVLKPPSKLSPAVKVVRPSR